MASQTITLKNGLKVGDKIHKEVTLRELTFGDIIDATEKAEKAYITATGSVEVIASPSQVGIELMCKQIEKFGTLTMPMTQDELRKLTASDAELIQKALDNIDAVTELSMRGRD